MTYKLEIDKRVEKKLEKIAKKDPAQYIAIYKKTKQILENPNQFKPLKGSLKGTWRVHISHFVLFYKIDERSKTVRINNYKHHDEAYKTR